MVVRNTKVSRIGWLLVLGIGGAAVLVLRSGPSDEAPAPDDAPTQVAPDSRSVLRADAAPSAVTHAVIAAPKAEAKEPASGTETPSQEADSSDVLAGTVFVSADLVEASFGEMKTFDRRGVKPTPTHTVQSACAKDYLNPTGTVLFEAQQQELQQLLDRQTAEEFELHVDDFRQRKESFLRAIRRGSQIALPAEELDPRVPPTRDSIAALNSARMTRIQDINKAMKGKLGREHHDWMRVQVAVTDASGARRNVVVYDTRKDEPHAFAAWDRVNAHAAAQRRQLRDFFAAVR